MVERSGARARLGRLTPSYAAAATSAAAFARLDPLVADGVIVEDDLTLVAITGFGLKDEIRL